MKEGHAERRLVTCVFIDIVASTELTRDLGPERMKHVVDDAFNAMSALIAARGGTIEKFIGDAVFVLFGAPVAHADDPERALRAASACARWAAEHQPRAPIAVRIGVETGEALIDLRAAERERQRMAVGECVNLASRLQALAEPGQILVGPNAHAATEHVAEFDAAVRVTPKGFKETEVWALRGVEGSRRASLPFVGRERELDLLRSAYGGVCAGNAKLALVIGPPGQGKSRLVAEIVTPLRREATVLEARCRPGEESGAATPLWQLLSSDVAEPSPESISLRMKDLLPESDAHTASAIAHSVGLLVDPRVIAVPRMEQREILTSAWSSYLDALAKRRPVVVWIEDIHWADPLVVRLIDRVSDAVASCLLVLATARPEFAGSADLRPSRNRLEIELGPLATREAHELARSANPVDEEALRRAQGNPLFIVELARARIEGPNVPLTVQAVIGARLDELPTPDRELLQRAAVAGETFSARDAALLSDREPAEVAAALGRLSHLRFIEPAGRSYRFHHILVHDVAYGRLAAEERLRLHARYAREGLSADDVEALAHHWWQAVGQPDASWVWGDAERAPLRREALHAHLAAASRLIERNAQERAVEISTRAVSLADDARDLGAAKAALGMTLARNARGDEAWQQRLEAMEVYRQAGASPPASLYADALEIPIFNFGYFKTLPENSVISRLIEEGERAARASHDQLALARLLTMRAWHADDGHSADEAARLIVAGADRAAYADPLARLAQVELVLGRIGRSTALFDEASARAAAGMPINEPELLMWRALLSFHAGDLEHADALADRLLAMSTLRSVHTQQHALGTKGLIHFGRGDWEALRAVARDLESLADRHPSASFCLVGAAAVAQGAAGDVIEERGASARLAELVDRMVKQQPAIRSSILMLPEVMQGNLGIISSAERAYRADIPHIDRQIWDQFGVQLAIARVIAKRWDDLAPLLVEFRDFAGQGLRMLGALAAAIEEERAARGGGAKPAHTELRALGYGGLSQLLSFRPVAA